MIGIIFDTENEAKQALNACSILGDDKPYTYIVENLQLNKWAIISDEKVEEILGLKGVNLSNWFSL